MKPVWVLHPSRHFLSLGHCWVQHTVCWRNHFYFLSWEKERWHSSIWHLSISHSKYNICSNSFSLSQLFLCWPKDFLVSFGPTRGLTQSPLTLGSRSSVHGLVYVCMPACSVASVVSNSLWPYGLSFVQGFSRQEYWCGLPCPPPGDLADPGIKLTSPASPALQVDSLPTESPGKPYMCAINYN